jgi:hypothetical protein
MRTHDDNIEFKCDASLPKTSESLQTESNSVTPGGGTILEERTNMKRRGVSEVPNWNSKTGNAHGDGQELESKEY